MNRTTTAARYAVSLGVILLTLACSKKDDAYVDTGMATGTGTTTMEPAAPAGIRVTEIEVGEGLNADKTLKDETGDFGVRDTIYAVVKTDGASAGAKLDAKWTFQSGQTVSESSQTVSPTGGEARHEFHLQKATAWPKGNYKVEIMLDGASAGTKDFSIK